MINSCDPAPKKTIQTQILSNGWELSELGTEQWIKAKVPGCVHTDLLSNNKIEDPFYRLNEHDLQWIDKKDWVYKTTFTVDKTMLRKDHIELRFPGLDTYAEIYLNDELILTADNMFREWNADCLGRLKKGRNKLEIIFRSPIKKGIEKYDALRYTIPVSDNDLAEIGKVPGNKKVSIFTRKAGYHFGWDWGPRFVTSGIWKPVILQGWNSGKIKNIQIIQHEISTEKALLNARVEIEAGSLSDGEINIILNNKILASRKVNADNITLFAEIPFEIENPELWWPNGLGDQPLYDIKVELLKSGQQIQTKVERIGLRTIELVTDPDDAGNTFHFTINGRPVFMKGANYIPQDSFLDRVSPDRYEHVIQSAVDANMNMLRVWGGGIYEKDIFYDLCDEKGILIWQDFMFACSMFPVDSLFLDNVKHEAIDNVKRLRNHPSIALWCGNNENLSAWLSWGWKEKVSKEQGEEVANILWKGYEDLFHEILPDVISEYDVDRAYWSSSSSAAMGVRDNLTQGDLHYWGVWWGKEPFSSFKQNTGRFMSEYGFQSFPEMKTISEYTTEQDWNIYSEVMKSHQRSSIGNETIELYMNRGYRKPKDFPSFIYVGQVLQAEGIKRAIELHRVQMPYCMGSLYWQIDDCWPVASWSGMDYFGRWKALHYLAREAFKNVILVTEIKGDKTIISTVSDLDVDFPARLKCSLMNFSGEKIWTKTIEIEVKGNSSNMVYSFNHGNLDKKAGSVVLESVLLENNAEIDSDLWYYTDAGKLELSIPKIESNIFKLPDNEFSIELSCNTLAKNIYLSSPGEGFFSDNYFDLLPGKKYFVNFIPESEIENPEISITSLVDTY